MSQFWDNILRKAAEAAEARRKAALPGSEPTVGEAGREEHVAELRLETVFPAELQEQVVAALRGAHPYEEPAFDIYPLVDV